MVGQLEEIYRGLIGIRLSDLNYLEKIDKIWFIFQCNCLLFVWFKIMYEYYDV